MWRQVFEGRHLTVLTHGAWTCGWEITLLLHRGEEARMSLRSRGVHRCAQVCTGVCVGGGWGQRAESRVGSCQKIRLPSTRHIEGSCVCPGHVFTLFALPGAGFVAETSELVTPPGPPGQGSLRLTPVTGFLPLLTCPARAPFPDSQSGSKDKYTHSRAPVLTCSCMSAAGQAGGVGKASRADSQTAPAWRACPSWEP